jgi:transmembrane sensor
VLLLAGGVLLREPLTVQLRADAVTRVGETKSLMLQDGSRIQLNTDSAIAVRFTPEAREIELLAGEAAFEVAHDAQRPFRVHARAGTSTALGTIFQVRMSSEGARVTVTEGRVRVQNGAQSTEIRAGEQLDYRRADLLGRAIGVDIEAASAWRRGRISFIDEPLGEVVKELDRYHRGRIILSDPVLASVPVSGVFETADPLAAVQAIERNLGLHARRFTDYIVVLND